MNMCNLGFGQLVSGFFKGLVFYCLAATKTSRHSCVPLSGGNNLGLGFEKLFPGPNIQPSAAKRAAKADVSTQELHGSCAARAKHSRHTAPPISFGFLKGNFVFNQTAKSKRQETLMVQTQNYYAWLVISEDYWYNYMMLYYICKNRP